MTGDVRLSRSIMALTRVRRRVLLVPAPTVLLVLLDADGPSDLPDSAAVLTDFMSASISVATLALVVPLVLERSDSDTAAIVTKGL